MESYDSLNKKFGKIVSKQKTWNAIEPENATRMTIQNRFQSGIEIAKVSKFLNCRSFILYKP